MWKLCPHFPDTADRVVISKHPPVNIERFSRVMEELTQTTVISWIFASRTCAIKVNLTDTANIVVWDIPSPGSHGVPFPDSDLHICSMYALKFDISGLQPLGLGLGVGNVMMSCWVDDLFSR